MTWTQARCGRPKTGDDPTPCRAWRITLGPACVHHLTDADRTQMAAEIAAHAAAYPVMMPELPTEPACWSWSVTEDDRAAAAAATEADAHGVLHDWQRRRCAVCSTWYDLVLDHDHETGLIRGWLCRCCNANEPNADDHEVLGLYRERNPATMLGIRARYWSPWSGWAKPAPPPLPLDENHPTYLRAAQLERARRSRRD